MSNHASNTFSGTFSVFVQAINTAEHMGEFSNFGEAHNFVTSDLREDFDLTSLRTATLDEVDTAVACMDIDGVFEAVFVTRALGADKDDFIAIVRDVRA